MDKMHILLMGNTAWGMYKFRGGLMRHLIKQGCKVSVAAPFDADFITKIEETGADFHSIDISAKGTSPVTDLFLTHHIIKLFKSIKPDFAFFYTIKPNIYGGIAAHCCKVPFISVTTGLGYTFINNNMVSKIARRLYKISFRYSRQVWFLNADDKADFLKYNILPENKCHIINGEGVDTAKFAFSPLPKERKFLLMARMLWDKGVGEYVEAARLLKSEFPDATFNLLGFLNVENPSAISAQQIEKWEKEGIINYLGATKDVRPFIEESMSIVLPSYREGIPVALLEAASMGRIIITTDVTGCRDVVKDGRTGFLCKVKDSADLADKIRQVMLMSEKERMAMGVAAREGVEAEFSEDMVFKEYNKAIMTFLK